jgi:transcriptional regulator of met regulon
MVEQELNERTRQTIEALRHCLSSPESMKVFKKTYLENQAAQTKLRDQGIDFEEVKKALLGEEGFI